MDAPAPSVAEPKPETPLLPALLLGPAAFLWLWVLPVGVLLLLNLKAYWLIEGNLNPSQRDDALLLGSGNLANLLIGVALYFFARERCRSADAAFTRQPGWGIPPLLVQIGYLWWAAAWSDRVLPASVITWIYPPERYLFNHFALAMLPLFLGILRLAAARPPQHLGKTIAVNLGIAIAGPVALYLLILAMTSFRGAGEIGAVVFVSGMVGLGVLMFVGLIRGLILALRSLQRWGATGRRVAIVIFAAVLPLCGLVLNRSIPFPVDFQAWEIYALVLVNAAILLLTSWNHRRWPRLSFHLLCATFPFSLYFFIVFLPYTPLSILAVIAMGAGFLVLAPIFLFVLHLYALHEARHSLRLGENKWRVTGIGALCFLLLPAFFTVRGLADKTALNAALDYVYSPAITGEKLRYPGSLTNLRRALSSHRSYKNGIYYPLLSDFYSWLVFDNLVLPDDKLDRLEKTFFGSAGSRLNLDPLRPGLNLWSQKRGVRDRARMPRGGSTPRTVNVSQLELSTAPLAEQNAITTLKLTLQNTGTAPAEFVQKLPLPAGVFVRGFRLHINGHPVPGRIFEKKTALWVYTMIRDSERRDPGLLYYNTRDELELRVFPVNADAPAVVEIDFLLPEPIAAEKSPWLSHDPAAVLAEIGRSFPPQITRDAGETTVCGLEAREFVGGESEPYLHLIVDRSSDNAFTGNISQAVEALQQKFPRAHRGRVTLANYDVVDLAPDLAPLHELAKRIPADAWENLPPSGGLALDLCLARALRQHRDLDLDHAPENGPLPPTPIFVILSGKASARALDLDLTQNWSDLVPHLELCELGGDGTFHVHRHETGATSFFRLGNSIRPLAARQAIRFQASDDQAVLAHWSPTNSTWEPVRSTTRHASPTLWSSALALQLQDQDYARTPGAAHLDRKGMVNASRDTGILLPTTSYIVVENSAQWRMLEISERQKLDQNTALAFRETPAPPALVLGLGLTLWLGIRRWRQRGNLPGPLSSPVRFSH